MQDVRFSFEIVKTNKIIIDTNVLEYQFVNMSDTRPFTLNKLIRIEPQLATTRFVNSLKFSVNANENDTTIYEITFDDPYDPDNNVLVIMKLRANYK